jgi:ATP-binding cassette subfamily C protein LapB
LLGCLTALTALYERHFSADSLTAGLPLQNGRLTPDLFIRAAARAGVSGRVVRRQLADIPRLVLPAVLLLDGLRACVLTKWIGADSAEIILPETGTGAEVVSVAQLEEDYSGYAIFVRPEYQFDGRTETVGEPGYRSWFWGALSSFWPTYSQVIIASILVNMFALASPLFIMNVYDRVVPNNAVETLWVLAIGAVTVFGFDFLLRNLRGYFVDAAGKSADVILASRIFQQVLNIEMSARPQSAGAFASNLRDFETVRDFFTSATVSTFVDLPFALFFILVIWALAGPVAYIPLSALPIMLLVGWFVQYPLHHAVQKVHSESAQKHGILVEAIGGLETVKSLGAEGRMQRQWERFVGTTAESSRRSRLLSSFAVNFSMFATQLVTVGTVITGVYLIKEGELTVGALIACVILGSRAMAPLAQLANILVRFQQSKVALSTLNKIMAMPVERPVGKVFVSRPVAEGALEFKDVDFSYPNQKLEALSKVSFRIAPGERVAIIGRIGSGKSTVGKLLVGLYQPTEGSVLADNVDLRQMDPADLRHGIGYVPQDVFLFYGSARDNIAMATPYADDSMVIRAAQLAGADDFIRRHPQGYDMPVGERGEALSGGQRQTIAVARALMLDPPVLVLDEPTSGMDHSSEQRLKDRLEKILPGKTLVVISHRASLLSLVDRVIILDGGKVVADGPRDTVLQRLREGQLRVPRR